MDAEDRTVASPQLTFAIRLEIVISGVVSSIVGATLVQGVSWASWKSVSFSNKLSLNWWISLREGSVFSLLVCEVWRSGISLRACLYFGLRLRHLPFSVVAFSCFRIAASRVSFVAFVSDKLWPEWRRRWSKQTVRASSGLPNFPRLFLLQPWTGQEMEYKNLDMTSSCRQHDEEDWA